MVWRRGAPRLKEREWPRAPWQPGPTDTRSPRLRRRSTIPYYAYTYTYTYTYTYAYAYAYTYTITTTITITLLYYTILILYTVGSGTLDSHSRSSRGERPRFEKSRGSPSARGKLIPQKCDSACVEPPSFQIPTV